MNASFVRIEELLWVKRVGRLYWKHVKWGSPMSKILLDRKDSIEGLVMEEHISIMAKRWKWAYGQGNKIGI